MRIAMWSGPRNLSTAMMYAFAARGDCAVWDEPFYAAYLAQSGSPHPMRDEIIAAGEVDPDKVAARCKGHIPGGKPHFYMKHMPHHMLDGFPMDWAKDCVNVHLIRHPARVVASYVAKRKQVSLEDIGFARQADVYARHGGIVVDSADIRANPARALAELCGAIGLDFTKDMLHWPAGGHAADGVWARHWYGAVHHSTGFAGPEGPLPELAGRDADLVAQALPSFETMAARKLNVG